MTGRYRDAAAGSVLRGAGPCRAADDVLAFPRLMRGAPPLAPMTATIDDAPGTKAPGTKAPGTKAPGTFATAAEGEPSAPLGTWRGCASA